MKPNFLIFVVDQMASQSLGCNGHPEVRTPNIDRLAAEGTTFRRAYCNNPVCQPSRATMLTGLTPRQHGLVSNGNALDGRVPTVTGALAAAGYRTHSVGKLHLQPFVNIARNCDPDDPVESCESEYAWRQSRVTSLPPDYYGFQTTEFLWDTNDGPPIANRGVSGIEIKCPDFIPRRIDEEHRALIRAPSHAVGNCQTIENANQVIAIQPVERSSPLNGTII